VLGDTRINGLATDGAQVFVAGESFGAPLVGSASIPGSVLAQYGPTGGVVPTSAAFVAGRLYAGLEYDVEAGVPTSRSTQWGHVVADDGGLLTNARSSGLLEYYAALPGNPPGAPALTAAVSGNTVALTWTPDPAGGAPTSYTVYAGSSSGRRDLAAIVVRDATALLVTAPNGLYYVTVVGRNGFGPGPPSNEVPVQVGPAPCTLPPTAPGPLTHTIAGTTVSLSWGGSPTAAAYWIDAGSVPGASNLASFPVSSATSIVVGAPLGVYYVRVRAASACGVSGPSNEIVVTVNGAVPLPEAPTGLTTSVAGDAVVTAWTPPLTGGTPAGYRLEAGYAPGASNAAVLVTTVRALRVTGVPRATYYVRVRAFNAAGPGPATPEVVVTVP
jgi:hypothetical protein